MRFNHVTIVVTELERSKRFYSGLGLKQLVDVPPRYARFTFPDGDSTLSLEVLGDTAPPGSEQAQLVFECDHVDATFAELRGRGVGFAQEPMHMFYGWREARLRDPDGHDVRLYEDAKGFRLDPPWRIKTAVGT